MIELIRNEFLKLRRRPIVYIAFALVFVTIASYMGLELYSQYQASQRQAPNLATSLKADVDQYKQEYDEAKTDEEKERYKIEIAKAEYCRDNKIGYDDYRRELVEEYFNVKDAGDEESVSRAAKLKDFIENKNWQGYYKDQIESLEKEMAQLDLSKEEQLGTYNFDKVSIEGLNLALKYNVDPSKPSFKSSYIEYYKNNKVTILDAEAQGNPHHIDIAELKKINTINLYRIENNVPPVSENAEAYNIDFMAMVNTLVIVLMTVIGATVFTSEFSHGTISQLLCYPYKRYKIVLSKLIVIILITILMQAFLFGISALAGNIIANAGANAFKMLFMPGNTIYELDFFYYLFLKYLCYFAEFLFYFSITLFFAVHTRNAAASIGIVLPILLIGEKVLGFISGILPEWQIWVIPFNTCDFVQFLDMDYKLPGYNFPWAVAITAATTAVFSFLGFRRFRRISI